MEIVYKVLLAACFLTWGALGVPAKNEPRGRPLAWIKKSDKYLAAHAKLKPGQIMPNLCAFTKNGCCKDFKTFAEGKAGRSCEILLCYDKAVGYCFDNRGKLNCSSGSRDSENCPSTCGKCKPPAPPIKKCLEKNHVHGCCWDGTIPLGRNGRGCRPCADIHRHPCATFKHVSGGCHSGSYHIRTYMINNCPKSCGFCHEANASQARKKSRHEKGRRQ